VGLDFYNNFLLEQPAQALPAASGSSAKTRWCCCGSLKSSIRCSPKLMVGRPTSYCNLLPACAVRDARGPRARCVHAPQT
jgi:hypothetical protein